MASPPEPHKIHNLPVLVTYHLPSSHETFTALFPSLQQVYVFPSAPAARPDDEDEAWGSIPLKTIVQGLVRASPEIHPAYPNAPDCSMYILDPRETYLRRSRSSPSASTSALATMPEVWTGKGLVSWALSEQEGKTLVNGRLVRSREFQRVARSQDGAVSALEALMMAEREQGQVWGIEISLNLRSGAGGSVSGPQMAMPESRPVAGPSHVQHSRHASSPHHHHHQPTRGLPLSPARTVVTATPTAAGSSSSLSVPKRPSTGKKRKSYQGTKQDQAKLSALDLNSRPSSSSASAHVHSSIHRKSSSPALLHHDQHLAPDTAGVYANPDSLTKEQAERLMESPAFLDILEKRTGVVIDKRSRAEEAEEAGRASRAKRLRRDSGQAEAGELKCYNCGRTKSAVWRMKVMEDGQNVRVCNACGLYWNKSKQMRPPSLWPTSVDADINKKPSVKSSSPAPHQARPAQRIDAAHHQQSFKRTLSTVAEAEARRIALTRRATQASAGSRLPHHPHTLASQNSHGPMTSPPRASTSQSRGIIAHSSPVWTRQAQQHIQESPNTAIRRILGASVHAEETKQQQSLDMPLSDDGQHGPTPPIHLPTTAATEGSAGTSPANQFDWQELSSFFDIEGFSSSLDPHAPSDYLVAEESTDAEDDVYSQLFNRTSSFGMPSSPSMPFDFSQLPPSSPPVAAPSSDGLSCSTLLMSSPDVTPEEERRRTPRKGEMGLRYQLAMKASASASSHPDNKAVKKEEAGEGTVLDFGEELTELLRSVGAEVGLGQEGMQELEKLLRDAQEGEGGQQQEDREGSSGGVVEGMF